MVGPIMGMGLCVFQHVPEMLAHTAWSMVSIRTTKSYTEKILLEPLG